MPTLSLAELADLARAPNAAELLGAPTGGGWVVTDLRAADPDAPTGGGWVVTDLRAADPDAPIAGDLGHLAFVFVAIGPTAHALADAFDVVVEDEDRAAEVCVAVDAHPVAATALALLLRGGERRTVAEGLVAESATYSALQGGPEHGAWLQALDRRPRPPRPDAPVRVERRDEILHITLDRPEVRNAYNAATRDALLDALSIAVADPAVTDIVLDGAGAAFCSGGDLDEFGTLTDPATAHVLRVARSVAHAVHELRERTTVHVHGACIGAGIELPAFAGRVVAHESATFRLPEVSMGLVPGAGGTVSIPRRVGRHRTAWMAITGAPVDTATALTWGLVDAVGDPLPD